MKDETKWKIVLCIWVVALLASLLFEFQGVRNDLKANNTCTQQEERK